MRSCTVIKGRCLLLVDLYLQAGGVHMTNQLHSCDTWAHTCRLNKGRAPVDIVKAVTVRES